MQNIYEQFLTFLYDNTFCIMCVCYAALQHTEVHIREVQVSHLSLNPFISLEDYLTRDRGILLKFDKFTQLL